MTGVPELKDELDRKVYETLSWLINGVENCRITPEQFSIGMDVMFMTASGLVDEDFMNIMTEANKLCVKPKVVKRHFVSGSKIRTLMWRPGGEAILIIKRDIDPLAFGSTAKKKLSFETAKEAYDKFVSLASEFEKLGWEEL